MSSKAEDYEHVGCIVANSETQQPSLTSVSTFMYLLSSCESHDFRLSCPHDKSSLVYTGSCLLLDHGYYGSLLQIDQSSCCRHIIEGTLSLLFENTFEAASYCFSFLKDIVSSVLERLPRAIFEEISNDEVILK